MIDNSCTNPRMLLSTILSDMGKRSYTTVTCMDSALHGPFVYRQKSETCADMQGFCYPRLFNYKQTNKANVNNAMMLLFITLSDVG